MQLWRQSARQVVAALGSGKLSAVEVVQGAIHRIEATHASVNAITARRFEQALEDARRADAQPRGPRAPGRRLAGLPVVIKDMTDVAGLATTLGDPERAHILSPRSDLCVERIEREGGIVLAKTNVPFMGLGHDTSNPLFGTTRNPWNTDRSTGGSSGGAAAALACGAAWLAHGSDLGGSIRGPAGRCGVVGLRPTPGLVAHGGIDTRRDPVEDQNLDGPMARDVADCALFLDAMAGASPEDPLSMPPDPDGYLPAALAPALPKRVAVSADLGVATVHNAVRTVMADLARRLAADGVEVDESGPPCDGIADAAYDLRLAWTRRRTSPAEFERRRPNLPDIAARTWLDSQSLTVDRLLAAQVRQQKLIDDMRRLFRQVDCLIIPANPSPPPLLRHNGTTLAPGTEHHWVHGAVLSYAVTLSWCPSLSLPAGLTSDRLPVGVQVIGPPRSERQLFRYGAAIEALCGIAPLLPIEPRATA